MATDKRGNPVSYSSDDAIAGLDRAIDTLATYHADPVAQIDEVLAKHPDFVMGHAFRAGMIATSSDKAFEPELIKSVNAAEKLASKANDRERGYIAAARSWLNGDFERATEQWGRVAIAYPRDLTAVQFSHLGDFFHAYSHMLRDRVARVLPHWHREVPGYGFVLGMYAFGLEESGDYERAEETGREALSLNPQDGWAAHAIAHVMEMQGRASDGVNFVNQTSGGWAPNSVFAYHIFWHQALFHLDQGEASSSLKLFDEKIASTGFSQALELIDGSAMLWRLQCLGHDVGGRWKDIAEKWASRIEDGYYVFNDMHAMMSYVSVGDTKKQAQLLKTLEKAALGSGTNAMMTREVGLPGARGIEAFGRGAYVESIEHLMPVRGKANRFGGSHAQRDIFSWTLTEAAIRSGDAALADALVAERLALKPESPLNQLWASRARSLSKRRAA
jgi:tetratricopeptide (TPR) repeat protein